MQTIAQLAAADPHVEIVFHNAKHGEVLLSAFEAVNAELGHLELDPGETCSAQLSDTDYNALVGISDKWHD